MLRAVFGRKAKIRKAVARALATIDAEDDMPELGAIEALNPALHGDAYGWLASELFDDERHAAARAVLERALAIAPDDLDLHKLAANLAMAQERPADAIVALQHIAAQRPRELEWVAALAGHLIDADRIDEAIETLEPHRASGDPTLQHRLAEALLARGDRELALELLDQVCEYYDRELKQMMSIGEWNALKSRADEASRLRNDIYAEVHGREATIELAAASRQLDGTAGVNYRLLGSQLATKSGRIAAVLELEDPDATEARGRGIDGARGLVLLGSAQLRRNELAAARKSFDRACELDHACFAAFFGVGAVLDHERYNYHRHARKLPPAPEHAALAKVVPDLPALTELERRVVWASVGPLAVMLPTLADANVTMRILPIDVRATDIGLFDEIAGERADDDQRSYDAISGLATHGGAIAKIEELLDTVTPNGWTFAHELAHLAFFHMPGSLAAPIHQLYERACEVGYANTEYALSNPDEFFAVSYADWLRVRHERPEVPIPDDAGIHDDLVAYFDALGFDRRSGDP
jgi:tetratricopeptide (TPR) repeat protein